MDEKPIWMIKSVDIIKKDMLCHFHVMFIRYIILDTNSIQSWVAQTSSQLVIDDSLTFEALAEMLQTWIKQMPHDINVI